MSRERIGILLAFAWLSAVVLAYTYVHNPFTLHLATSLGLSLLDVAAVALLLVVAGGLGTLLVGDATALSALERAGLRALLGLGVISIAVLVIGLAGLFPPGWLAWVIMLVMLAGLLRWARDWWRDVSEGLTLAFARLPGAAVHWVVRGVLFLLGLTLLMALSPPTTWDALTYHLAGPRHYLDAGRIVSFPENHFLGFPQVVEMLYLWLMILARPQAAALLHGGFGVLTLLTMLGLGQRLRRPSAGWLAAAILLASESVWAQFHWAYNDLALMAFTLAALVALLAWNGAAVRQRDCYLVLTGVFVGLAMGTKYTAAGAAVGIGVLALWIAPRARVITLARAGAMVTAVALAVWSSWPLKNTLLDGSPFLPFLGAAGFDRFDRWYYLRPGTGYGLRDLVLAPLQAAIFGAEGISPYNAATGALLFGLLPLAAVGWPQRDRTERALISRLLIFAVPPYLAWLYGIATSWFLVQTRLLFPIFPALALVGAFAVEGLRDFPPLRDLLRLVRAVVVIALALAVFGSTLTFVRTNPVRVTLGLRSEDDYLRERLGTHYAAMEQVNALPEDARVQFLWEPRIYYCERDCIPDSLIDEWWHARQLEPDPLAIAAGWREQGITHVLIFEAGLDFLVNEEPHEPLDEADLAALDSLRGAVLVPIWDEFDSYTLYELQGESP